MLELFWKAYAKNQKEIITPCGEEVLLGFFGFFIGRLLCKAVSLIDLSGPRGTHRPLWDLIRPALQGFITTLRALQGPESLTRPWRVFRALKDIITPSRAL